MKQTKTFNVVAVVLLSLALLATVSCSTTEDSSSTEDDPPAQATPDPAFDPPLLSILQDMTAAPIMLPATIPSELKSPPELRSVAVAPGDPRKDALYTTNEDKYTIVFLSAMRDSSALKGPYTNRIVQPWVHCCVPGTLTAEPASTLQEDPSRSGAKVIDLDDVALPDGTMADLKRIEPPEGANWCPCSVGMFEEEGYRYTLRLERLDSPEGDLARQILSTMIKVPRTEQANNGKVAFANDRDGNFEVYVMNSDGSEQTNLTNNEALDSAPAFSPDGERIVFTSNRDGNDEIYVMSADGTNPTNLTNNKAHDNLPAFSPDGERIAFASSRDGNYEIYVMNADGSGQTRLTNSPGVDSDPAFSPDGTRIAFVRSQPLPSGQGLNNEIYVMNADGSEQTPLTDNPSYDGEPTFSPDGTLIAFTSWRMTRQGSDFTPSPDVDVYVMNADGTNPTNLTNNPGIDAQPAFSSDGLRIAFTSERDGNREVYMTNLGGTNQTRLTDDSGADVYSAFHPTGQDSAQK
jgi:Tol biopolymer transport system component